MINKPTPHSAGWRTPMRLAAGVLLAILLTSPVRATEAPVFDARFNGSAVAVNSAGQQVAPLKAEGLAYADGIDGKCLRADTGNLVYPASVVPKDTGTLEVWVSPLPAGCKNGWYFFSGDASEWGPEGVPRLWMYEGRPRFDVDGGARLLCAGLPPGPGWSPGAWHQLVGTWDRSGKVALYADGQLLAHQSVPSWPRPDRQGFTLGAGRTFGSDGSLPANALIARARLYDRVLSPTAILANYREMGVPQLSVALPKKLLLQAPAQLTLQVKNVGGKTWSGALAWETGARSGNIPLHLPVGRSRSVLLRGALSPKATGEIPVRLSWNEGIRSATPRTATLSLYIPPALPAPTQQAPRWRLVRRVDCAAEAPVSQIGMSRVLETPAGRCREAGSATYDRFAYVFPLGKRAGKGSASSHLLRLTFTQPDDRKRCTQVSQSIPNYLPDRIAGTEQQVLGHGILSGGLFPLTGRLITRQYVFHCPSDQVAIIIETGAPDQPAAASTLTLEEAEEPEARFGPAAPLPALGAREHRRAGLYWEDPVLGQCFGWTGTEDAPWDRTLVRAMDYLAWTGQDLIEYPTVWYSGPIYQSRVEPGTWPSGARYHPAAYPRILALRCSQRGVRFVPTFTIWRLPSLASWIRTPEEVIAGEPAVNTVTREGKVLTKTNWGSPPLLNAQHPRVQKAILDLVDEHIALCGDQESFAGVGFSLWPSSPMQAGAHLLTSYDDATVSAFAKAIGQALPGDPRDADRFRQRADWILNDPARRAAWVRWRCNQMTRFYAEAGRHLAQAGHGAKLHLMIQQPYPEPNSNPAQELLEQGIDLAALARDPNIVLDRWLNQTTHREQEKSRKPETVYYDQAELTPEFQRPFAGLPRSAATVHQQYFESHAVLNPEWGKNTPKLKLPAPWQVEATGRCCQPAPPGRHFLRHWARSLSLFDAQWLAIGGFCLGTLGDEEEVRPFALAFRALPAVPFTDLHVSGPVVARTAAAEGARWYYAVNPTDQPATLSLPVSGGALRDAVTGKAAAPQAGRLKIELAPYELRAWKQTGKSTAVSAR